MVSGACLERVLAVCPGQTARRPRDYRRALVVRLIGLGAVADVALARLPGSFEVRAAALRVVALQKCLVARDPRRDEVIGDFAEDRASLRIVRGEQRAAPPALKAPRELPAEIDRVIEPIVEPEAAIGWMAVRGVA